MLSFPNVPRVFYISSRAARICHETFGVEEFIALKSFVCDFDFCTIYCFASLVIVIVGCP